MNSSSFSHFIQKIKHRLRLTQRFVTAGGLEGALKNKWRENVINPFPALIKSKYLLNFDYFCSIFFSRRWSAVSLNHSIPPESMMNQLRDGGGFVA